MSEQQEQPLCGICGEPMPEGEEMFKYHGYSCDCPKPPLHPSVRGERNAGDADILTALVKHATGDVGEDAYIRLYPADARRILGRVKKLEAELEALRQQHDAALALADKWESGDYGTLFSDFSNELRAIFKEKP